ncbi:MAG TPA: hypothetical protein VL443_08180 [Cyclobacteriaceae bacterium]|jgi:hypothetical protein|nr:hypothetical protein [Cyclobacteriaceae bacterium]
MIKREFEVKSPRTEMKFATIDQSYTECGIAVFEKGQIVKLTRLNFRSIEVKNKVKLKKKHKRQLIQKAVKMLVDEGVQLVVVERVRTFSAGFISTNAISALSELIATIIDSVPDDIPVVSVDTRAWKARIGISKAAKEDKKKETITWAQANLPKEIAAKRKTALTDNEADAFGMGIAFIKNVKVIEEE